MNPPDPSQHNHPVTTAIGIAAPVLAFLVSHLSDVEPWLRVICLLLGAAVSVQALARGRRRRKRGN